MGNEQNRRHATYDPGLYRKYVDVAPGTTTEFLTWEDSAIRPDDCDWEASAEVHTFAFNYKLVSQVGQSGELTGSQDMRGLQVSFSFVIGNCPSEIATFDLVNGTTVVVPATKVQARIIYPLSPLDNNNQPNIRVMMMVGQGDSRQSGSQTLPRLTIDLGSITNGQSSTKKLIPRFAESVFIQTDTSSISSAVVTQYLGDGSNPFIVDQGTAGITGATALPVASGAGSFDVANGAAGPQKFRAVWRLAGI